MRLLHTIYCILFLLFGSSFACYSQSMYLNDGQSGIGGGLGYSADKNNSTISFDAGYSIVGRVDLGIGYASTSPSSPPPGYTVSSSILSPNISVFVVRQDSTEDGASICFSLGYVSASGSSVPLQPINSSSAISGTGYSIGGMFTKRHLLTQSLELIPSLAIQYSELKMKTTKGYWIGGAGNKSSTGFIGGVSLAYSRQLAITPQVYYSNASNESVFGFGLSLVGIVITAE
jgi:hypothetical protein